MRQTVLPIHSEPNEKTVFGGKNRVANILTTFIIFLTISDLGISRLITALCGVRKCKKWCHPLVMNKRMVFAKEILTTAGELQDCRKHSLRKSYQNSNLESLDLLVPEFSPRS